MIWGYRYFWKHPCSTRWWQLKYVFIFTPIWGRFPFWPIFFRWVEATNQRIMTRYWWFGEQVGNVFPTEKSQFHWNLLGKGWNSLFHIVLFILTKWKHQTPHKALKQPEICWYSKNTTCKKKITLKTSTWKTAFAVHFHELETPKASNNNQLPNKMVLSYTSSR